MNIETKFNIGDEIYEIDTKTQYVKETCSVCNGTKKVTLTNSLVYPCPECHGTGVKPLAKKTEWYVIDTENSTYPKTIGEINIRVTKGEVKEITYSRKKSARLIKENFAFATFEEAQAMCDKLNMEAEQ